MKRPSAKTFLLFSFHKSDFVDCKTLLFSDVMCKFLWSRNILELKSYEKSVKTVFILKYLNRTRYAFLIGIDADASIDCIENTLINFKQ